MCGKDMARVENRFGKYRRPAWHGLARHGHRINVGIGMAGRISKGVTGNG
jgi:hypothetical protein